MKTRLAASLKSLNRSLAQLTDEL